VDVTNLEESIYTSTLPWSDLLLGTTTKYLKFENSNYCEWARLNDDFKTLIINPDNMSSDINIMIQIGEKEYSITREQLKSLVDKI
jgi:hypothetical protein